MVPALLASFLLWQSQPPSPTPTKTAQDNQGNATSKQAVATSNQNDAKSLSTAIDKLTSEVAAWKKQQAAEERERDPSSGGWAIWSTIVTAFATIAIAFLGYFQWRAMHRQADYMRRALQLSIRQTRLAARSTAATEVAANAAKSSAGIAEEALRIAERADLFLSNVNTDKVFSTESCVGIEIKNFGRTTAEGVILDMSLSVATNFAESDIIFRHQMPTLECFALAAGDTISLKIGPIHAKKEIINEVNGGMRNLYLRVNVLYRDVFSATHTTNGTGTFIRNDGRFSLKTMSHT
jgi:hypothetical protein